MPTGCRGRVDWNQKGQPGAPGAPGQPGEKGDQGPQGIQGMQGQQGLQGLPGEPGQDGVSGYEIVTGGIIPFPPGVNSMRTVLCPEGKRALGGGVSAGVNGVVTASFPLDVAPFEPGQLWAGGVKNTSATDSTDTNLWVICASVE